MQFNLINEPHCVGMYFTGLNRYTLSANVISKCDVNSNIPSDNFKLPAGIEILVSYHSIKPGTKPV